MARRPASAGAPRGKAPTDGDLSVAKAVEGPRDDWRVFLILGAKY